VRADGLCLSEIDTDVFEQVHGGNLRRMVTQEGLPSLAGGRRRPSMYLVMHLIERSQIRARRSLFVSRTRPGVYASPHDSQLISKHRLLSFRPQLRPEWRGQDGQNETEQPDHLASLVDSIAPSLPIAMEDRAEHYPEPAIAARRRAARPALNTALERNGPRASIHPAGRSHGSSVGRSYPARARQMLLDNRVR
jgi:hypothetical protein